MSKMIHLSVSQDKHNKDYLNNQAKNQLTKYKTIHGEQADDTSIFILIDEKV